MTRSLWLFGAFLLAVLALAILLACTPQSSAPTLEASLSLERDARSELWLVAHLDSGSLLEGYSLAILSYQEDPDNNRIGGYSSVYLDGKLKITSGVEPYFRIAEIRVVEGKLKFGRFTNKLRVKSQLIGGMSF